MANCPRCGNTEAAEGEKCPACGAPVSADELPEIIPMAEPVGDGEEFETHELGPVPLTLAPETPAPPPARRGKSPKRGKSRRRRPRPKKEIEPDSQEVTVVAPIMEQHAGLQVHVRYEYSAVPADDPPVMGILAGVEAYGDPLVMADSGPVAHVVLALDLSASMDHPEKYPVLRAAVEAMLSDLCEEGAADVILSVVIFSRRAKILLRDTLAREVDREELFRAIEESPLCFGNYTDIAGALSHAGRIAFDQRWVSKVMPVRVYLLTDGKPQDMGGAQEAAERVGKVITDIHGLAFGSDADVMALQELFSGRRGGTVKSVRKDTLEGAFERVGEVAQRVVATRCLLDLDLAPGVVGGDVFRYRPARVRYPEPAFRFGKKFATDLGAIETDRSYQILFEVRPQESEESVSVLGTLRVRIPGFGEAVVETVELSIPRLPAGSLPGEVDNTVRTARDILTALTDEDPQSALRALRLRLGIYERERRDPGLLAIIRRAIELLESDGSLDGLSPDEHATLLAHTCT